MIQEVEFQEACKYCEAKENIWDFLDGGFVICLQERDDRYQKALIEVHRTGLCQLVKFYRAQRSPDGFVAGCWSSHVEVAKLGKDSNHETTLALEDDFELDPKQTPESIAQKIKSCIANLPKDKWKRLSLGQISWFRVFYAKGVDRSASVLTHAHIWSLKGLEWMIDHPYKKNDLWLKTMKVQVDGFISYTLTHSYSMNPMVAFQRNEGSDNAVKDEPLLEAAAMQATNTWIPAIWIISSIMAILGILFVMKSMGVSWILSGLLPCLFFMIVFGLIWGLVLNNVI